MIGPSSVVSYRNSTSNHNRIRLRFSERIVVSYRNSTSNHNKNNGATAIKMLYLIEILHQTTTVTATAPDVRRCILSKFYIKPQLPVALLRYVVVVSYRNSTSNHNGLAAIPSGRMLYLIEILHQTTTPAALQLLLVVLYLIEILHQTTTVDVHEFHEVRCILSKFYIKPQRLSLRNSSGTSCILSKFYIKPQLLKQ